MNSTLHSIAPLLRRYWLVALGAGVLVLWLTRATFGGTPVTVVHPTHGPAVEAVYATGTVEAAIMLPIASRFMARLAHLGADEGAEVVKDQVLAELENQDLLGALTAARARETFARSEFERNRGLYAKGAVAVQVFEHSKSEWEAAKAAVVEAEAKTSFLKLVAPADGRLIRRDGEIGQLIPANQPIFWLSVASPLRISAEVDEEDIASVAVGQSVVVRADAFPGQVFKAQVKSITPKGDPIARSYRVRIELSETTPLQIGMTAETNIIVRERQNALLIPTSAVLKDAVWRLSGSRIESQPVTVGISGPDSTEILTGLSTEDLVVISPSATLRPGLRVRATQASKER